MTNHPQRSAAAIAWAALPVLAFLVMPLALHAQGGNFTSSGSSTDWDADAAWVESGSPGAADTVSITHTRSLDGPEAFGGGGASTWSAGGISLGGNTLTFDDGAGAATFTFSVDPGFLDGQNTAGSTFVNEGANTFTHATSGDLFVRNQATFDNDGTYDFNSSSSTAILSIESGGAFDNSGTVRTASGGISVFIATSSATELFTNQSGGLVLADQGTLNFNPKFTDNGGTFRGSNGGALNFTPGDGSTTLASTEYIGDTSGGVRIGGTWSSDILGIATGNVGLFNTLNVNADMAISIDVTTNGTSGHVGTPALSGSVPNTLGWQAGFINLNGNTLTVTTPVSFTNEGYGLDGVHNNIAGSTFVNAASNTFTYASTGDMTIRNRATFDNQGTFEFAAVSTTAVLILQSGGTFDNSGTVQSNVVGTMNVTGGATENFTNQSGGLVTVGNGTLSIASSLNLDNQGTMEVNAQTANATMTVASSVALSQESGTSLTGGTWRVSADPTRTATMNLNPFTSITTIGTGATVDLTGSGATLTQLGTGLATVDGTFLVNGTRTFTTGGPLAIGSTGTIGGSGTLNAAAGTVTNNSGNVSPGASVGTLTIDGNYTSAANTTFLFEIDTSSGTVGDVLDINGTYNEGASQTLDITGVTGGGTVTGPITFLVWDTDGASVPSDSNWSVDPLSTGDENNVTWTGSGGNENWDTPGNWDFSQTTGTVGKVGNSLQLQSIVSGGGPTANSAVTITGNSPNAVIGPATAETIKSLTIDAGEQLTVFTGKLTATDSASIAGTLDISNGYEYENQSNTTGVNVQSGGSLVVASSGSGTFTAGILTLSSGSSSSFGSGANVIVSNTLNVSQAANLPSGTTLNISGATTNVDADLTAGGTLTSDSSTSTDVTGATLAATGATLNGSLLNINGSGTANLGGVNVTDLQVSDGTLNVASGTVTSGASGTFNVGATGIVSAATLNLSGANSITNGGSVTATDTASFNSAATFGSGTTLDVTNATLNVDANLDASAGTFTATGASIDVTAGTLTGAAIGAANVNVNGAGGVTATGITLTGTYTQNTSGAVNLGGGALSAGTISLTGSSPTNLSGMTATSAYEFNSVTVAADLGGAGATLAANGGTVVLTGTNTYGGATTLGNDAGILRASQGLPFSGTVNIGQNSTLEVGNASLLTLVAGDINNTGGDDSATITALGPVTLGSPIAGKGFEFTGTVAVGGQIVSLAHPTKALLTKATIAGGTIGAITAAELVSGGDLTGNGVVSGVFTNEGTITASGGTLTMIGPVNGNGSFSGVTFPGVVGPGLSPGTMLMNDPTFLSSAELDVEIGGFIAGSEFDQIILSGSSGVLAGTLDIELINGFTPGPGDSFLVVDASGATFTGAFTLEASPPVLPSGLPWLMTTDASGVTLSIIVPEPSSIVLGVMGLLAVVAFARRRRRTS